MRKKIKSLLNAALIMCSILFINYSCAQDPYDEGMHWDYSIRCEDGFKYKVLGYGRGVIPCYNSDGTKLRCDKKRY